MRGRPDAELQRRSLPSLIGLLSLDADGDWSFAKGVVSCVVDGPVGKSIPERCDSRLDLGRRKGCVDVDAEVDPFGQRQWREIFTNDRGG